MSDEAIYIKENLANLCTCGPLFPSLVVKPQKRLDVLLSRNYEHVILYTAELVD